MSFEEVWSVLQSQKSGSSGSGGSYHAIGATCGMKSRAFEHWGLFEQDEDYKPPTHTPTGKPKVVGRIAGAYFHALQQHWRTGKFNIPTSVSLTHEDFNYETAARCFQAYREHFNNDPENRGKVLDAEVRCPANDAEVSLVKSVLGDIPFSIRHDLRVHINEALVEKILLNHGIVLPGPGDYLVDYKLIQSITPEVIDNYRYGFQAISYPVTYNICHPDTPVRGILYDLMARVIKPEDRHFALVLAEPGPQAQNITIQGVKEAWARREAGEANPMMCDKTAFGSCRLMANNQCPRYGRFEDFVWGPRVGDWRPK